MSAPFKIGTTLIIVAEKNLFKIKELLNSGVTTDEVVSGLHFVELTVVEQRQVQGDYEPLGLHDGYRALGSDGFHYLSQWDKFDDFSTNPYGNWQREFVANVHYKLKADGSIDSWIIPKSEFLNHYLNWDVTSSLRGVQPSFVTALVEVLNKRFPSTQVFICPMSHLNNGAQGPVVQHSTYGMQYLHRGCFMCKHVG